MNDNFINTLPIRDPGTNNESVIIIRTTWYSDEITFSVCMKTSAKNGFSGKILKSSLYATATALEIDQNDFMTETQAALVTENGLPDFTYLLEVSKENTTFKWCKATTTGLKITFGSVILQGRDDIKDELLIDAIMLIHAKNEIIKSQKHSIEGINDDFDVMKTLLETCIQEKNNLENQMLTKFAALLNSKKEKISSLKRDFKNASVAVDYESDSADDSDLEYSSQSFANIPLPSASYQHPSQIAVVPKRIKAVTEETIVRGTSQIDSTMNSPDIYERETEVLIEEM